MTCLFSDAPIPDHLYGAIVALGNFDGFHLGHQAVVAAAVARAHAEGRPVIVATFDPHPVRFFCPDLPPFALTTIPQRARLFEKAGADATFVIRFSEAMANLSPEEFIQQQIIDHLKAAGVVTGRDFTFGKGRKGGVDLLQAMGQNLNISVDTIMPVCDQQGAISSTRIREALKQGDPETAARLLSRPFTVEGVVRHGNQVGRQLGFPTANLLMGDYVRPAYGIYAVKGRLPDGRYLDGAANLGIRPSFSPPTEWLEPCFFDWEGDIYDQTIAVSLIAFLRPEQKFKGMDALIQQIGEDCKVARACLSEYVIDPI